MDILAPLKKLVVVWFASEYNCGDSGTALTVDFSNGQKQRVRLTGNATLTISPAPGVGHYQLRIIQDATGGRTLAFSGLSSSRWLGAASQPGHNTAANGETILSLYYDGANWTQGMALVGVA